MLKLPVFCGVYYMECYYVVQAYIIQSSGSGTSHGFHLSRSYGHEKSRILSLAWNQSGQSIAMGTASGKIKKYNVSTGSCELTVLCEKDSDCIIWDLAYLESSIVSADSLGRVRFWNEENGTLLQSFKEHTLDVLSICAAPCKGMLFSTGTDQKIVLYQKVKETGEWIRSSHLKSHTHDVRAMDLSVTGFLATGGVDTNLNIVHVDNFNASGVKRYDAFQGSTEGIVMDTQARFIVQQSNSAVKVWNVSRESDLSPVRVLEMKSNDLNYILSVSIASNGSKMAVSTVHKLFVYCLDESFLHFQCLLELELPSYKMKFSEDGSVLLLATVANGICSIDTCNSECKDILRIEEVSSLLPITVFSTNKDCSYFAATGFSNETLVCCSSTGSVVYKFSATNSHTPRHAFTGRNSLVIFLSGKILSYDVSCGEMVEVGVVQSNKFLPRDVCILDDDFAAILYSQSMSVFRYTSPSENKTICNKRLNTSSSFLLAASMCASGKIVMIEQPLNKLMKALPPVLNKEHYGT